MQPAHRIPKKYKRLKCKLPQNYQCGGKCQPARFNCKKTINGVPKSALEWVKYVEERKAKVSAINDRHQNGRSRLEIDDLGFVKRVGQSVNFDRRKGKIDGDVIPQIDLHLFLKPGDQVITKENGYSKEEKSVVDRVKTKTFMAKDLKGKYMAWTVPLDNIQSVIREGKTYSVERTGEWTDYIEDGIKNGTLDWEKFNLKDKFPSLYRLYGKQSKPGKLSTEKTEGKKFKFDGTRVDGFRQSGFLNEIAEKEEKRLPSLLKKAKQWAAKPPSYSQISRQRRKIELTRRLLKKEKGLNDWIKEKAGKHSIGKDPLGYIAFIRQTRFPSVEREEAILSAMMGDGGKKLKEKYPVFLQEIKNISNSIFSEANKHREYRNAKDWKSEDYTWESEDYTQNDAWRSAKEWESRYGGKDDYGDEDDGDAPDYETADSFWEDFNKRVEARLRGKFSPKSVFGVKLTGDHDKDLPLVKSAYRKAAKKAHPDTGGNDAAFRKVNEEWERYLKSLPSNYSEPYLLWR